jgi:Subtilase family
MTVLSVAAVGVDRNAASFTAASATTDLAAPGVGVLAAVPPAFDTDGDGYRALSGTGVAAAMAGAAAAWLLAMNPSLSPDQVANALTRSAQGVDEEGVDSRTGWGMLNVARALAQKPGRADVLEPNEDVRWIDGSELDRAQPALRTGHALFARLDRYEDPADVYRVRLRPRATVRVSVRVSSGDPALAAFDAGTPSVRDRSRCLGRSDRRGRRFEVLELHNRARRARTLFLRVTLSRDSASDAAAYRLGVKRAR